MVRMGYMEVDFIWTNEQKLLFAKEFIKNENDARLAALATFGDRDTALWAWAATEWPHDPFVLAEIGRLKSDPNLNKEVLPTETSAVLLAWNIANDKKADNKERLAALKICAEIQGWIKKEGTSVSVNTSIGGNVMIVKEHGTDKQWEDNLQQQQQELIKH